MQPISPAIQELQKLLGARNVLWHPDDLRVYSYDGSNNMATPDIVVLPETANQISSIIKIARRYSMAIVPRGSGTGLCGAATPIAGGIMIAFARMKKILDIDLENRAALVEPGVINLDVSTALAPYKFFYAPDPSSQAACSIGGNVANNSGGPHCLLYGVTANHVLGLEVVLEDGEILWLGGSAPDEQGYDLVAAFIGSEGTLGIITKILVRIMPLPEATRTLLAVFNTIEQASRTVSGVIGAGVIPAAIEMIDGTTIRAVEAAYNIGLPLDADAVLLIEVDGPKAGIDELQEMLADFCQEFGAREVRIARNEQERADLWKARKTALGALGRLAPNYYIQDGVVPRSKLPYVLQQQDAIAKKYNVTIANVLHAGDGNLHPNILFDAREAGALERVKEAGGEILKLCVDVGGTISGEHGVGLEKLDYMPLLFQQADLDAQAKLRDAIAPTRILNPCKMLPQGSKCGEAARSKLPQAIAGNPDVWI
jgi:glycolate oxidase